MVILPTTPSGNNGVNPISMQLYRVRRYLTLRSIGTASRAAAGDASFRSALLLIRATALISLLQSPVLAQDYKIAHCFQGCPTGTTAANHLIIRPTYALSYNTATKSADWVAYRVSSDSIGIASSLSRRPLVDEYVEETLEEADFFGTEEQGLIRAQYVPLVDFAGSPFWNDVNYLTNSVARSRSLSQGAWYGLDWSIRNLVNRLGDVYVITGPVYHDSPAMPQLQTGKQHRVPDAFFKIVVTAQGNGAAFLMNQDAAIHVHHCDMRASVDEIEELTGLSFFPDGARPTAGAAYTDLGCN